MAMRLLSRAPTALAGRSAVKSTVTPLRPMKTIALRQRVVAAASDEASDKFEKVLAKAQDKFEKSDKKAAVAGYAIGAFAAIMLAEWLMHLPLLNALIGFPIQLVGLLATPVLVTRWVLDGKDWEADIDGALTDITKKLPGL